MMIFVNPDAKVNRNVPNIGLAYAATHFNAKVIDLNTKPNPKDRFLDCEADVVGISVRSLTYSESVRIAELYKARYPSAKIKSISGFLDVQCCYPYLDFEEKIAYDKPFSDEYPFPNYGLFDSFSVFKRNWQKKVWNYAIMTSQGCPYKCIYCVSRNRKWRARSAENCFEEIKMAKVRWNVRSFEILDDCFNIDKQRVIRLCELIEPLKLDWFCTNGLRADRFDEDIAKAMSKSGCKHITFGVESAVPEVLEAIKKGETIEQIEKAVKIAKKYFQGVAGFFIIGLPKSSYERDLYSFKWAKRQGINAHFSYYVPMDKAVQFDSLFYGEGAQPMSDEYPKEFQMRIYKMTGFMRPSGKRGLLRKLLARFKS